MTDWEKKIILFEEWEEHCLQMCAAISGLWCLRNQLLLSGKENDREKANRLVSDIRNYRDDLKGWLLKNSF